MFGTPLAISHHMKIDNFFRKTILPGALLIVSITFSAHAALHSVGIQPIPVVLAMVDPTQPDFSNKTTAKTSKTVKKKEKNPVLKLSLQQTLVSNKRKFAVINGRTMTIGKKIRGAKLIKINHDNVVLTYGGKRYTLNLTFPSAIKEVKR